jgi:gliding motility-associated-like protein
MKIQFIVLLSLFIYKPAFGQLSPANKTPLPVMNGFMKNAGQVRGLDHQPVTNVFYEAKIAGQGVYVTDYGLSVLLSRIKTVKKAVPAKQSGGIATPVAPGDTASIYTWELERIDLVLEGASIRKDRIETIRSSDPAAYNFMSGDWPGGNEQVHLQQELLIRDIYPGIDWRIYLTKEKGGNLKYDFIVHPGGDPSRIRIRYSSNAKLASSGNTVKAVTRMGELTEDVPYSYSRESGKEVQVRYRLQQNTIRFDVSDHKPEETLVIDPSLFWLTYISSTAQYWIFQSVTGNDIETDAAGNIFVQLSMFLSVPFPTINPGGGAYYQEYTASPEGAMVLMKFAPGGQLLWSTYFGNGVSGRLMTLDPNGNIYVIGNQRVSYPSYPNPNPTIPLMNNGGFYDPVRKDKFIARFSNNGVLQWSSYLYSPETYPIDMSFDLNGNVYVVGWSTVWGFPVVDPGGGAYMVNTPQYGASQVLFISQFNAATQLTWSTRIEGDQYDPYARVCTDKVGNIYIGGQTRSSNYPLVNAGGYYDDSRWGSVITRFNPARHMTWSTYVPGPFALADITTDDSCNLYVAINQRILKFDSSTVKKFEVSVPTTQMHFWQKINYDRFTDQIVILGQMNAGYWGFPTLNTACNGSFYNDGINPHTYSNSMGPIFATITHDGSFSYRSLVDWVYEYYEYNEMAIDRQGNQMYLFGQHQNGFTMPNPQLTNPGNGAYFNSNCCYGSNSNYSAMLMKLNPSELSVNTLVTAPVGCNCDGVITAQPLCGVAPFTYLWSTGAVTPAVTGLCPGNYWVKVTDANNLSRIVNVQLPYPTGSISAVSALLIPENCDRSNGSLEVQQVTGGTAPFSYSLDGVNYSSVPLFTGLATGDYYVRVKDGNGCVFTDTLRLDRVAAPASVSFSTMQSSCRANDGQLQTGTVTGGAGPYQYSLSGQGTNNTGLFTNLAAGIYQLRVTDTAGCFYEQPVTITQAASPVSAQLTITDDHCNSLAGSVSVSGITGGQSPYQFSTDSITFVSGPLTQLGAGSYSVYIRDVNGCILKKSPVIIQDIAGPANADFSLVQAYCGKQTGEIQVTQVQGGVGPYSYGIDAGGLTTQSSIPNITPGTHQLVVKDAFGCIYRTPFTILYKPMAAFRLTPPDTVLCYDEEVQFRVIGDPSQMKSISWNLPVTGNPVMIKAIRNLLLEATITDINNCVVKDSSVVTVKACNPPEKCIAVPSAFTPNMDGKNDKAGPMENGCRISALLFRIYNRWGSVVFETENIGVLWDGKVNGIAQDTGVYMYICYYTAEDGINRMVKGTITLIR